MDIRRSTLKKSCRFIKGSEKMNNKRTTNNTKEGYVYILKNDSIPGLYKVGRTRRSPEERARELSSQTGVPTPFEVAHEEYFSNCIKAEKEAHTMLNKKGFKKKKEFFEAELEDIIRVVVDIKKVEIEEGVKKDKKKHVTTTDRKRIKNPKTNEEIIVPTKSAPTFKALKYAIFIVVFVIIISIIILNPWNIDSEENNNEDSFSITYIPSGDSVEKIGPSLFVIEIDPSFIKQNAYLVKVKRGIEEKHLQIIGYGLDNERTHTFVEGVQINYKETEKIEVKTSGDWEIELTQLQNVSVASVPGEFSGSGNYAFKIDNSIELAIISGNKDKRPFHIRGYSKDLDDYEDIISPTTESLDEEIVSVFTSLKLFYFIIRATEDWDIKLK